MNAIDQTIAPAPVRQDPPPSRKTDGGTDTPAFGDVYSKSGNGSQGNGGSDGKSAADNQEAPATRQPDAGTAAVAAKTAPGAAKAAGAIAKFALEGKADAQMASTQAAAAEADQAMQKLAKAAEDTKKANAAAVANAGAANSEEQQAAKAGDNGSLEAMLQLLGAKTAAKGQSGQHKDAAGATDISGKKDAKDKDAAAKDTADGKSSKDVNLAAGAFAVQPVSEKPSSKDSGDTVYRFSRADGSGRSVDMTLGKNADHHDGTDKNAKVEHVSVLDARRFLSAGEGGVSSNTKALLAGMTGNKDWAAAMKAASAAHHPSEPAPGPALPVNTLKIQMNPQDLGAVTATLRLRGDELVVHLSVESGEAFRQLSADKDGLVSSLKSQGFSVDQVNIQMTASAPADKGVAQSASSGQQQQAGGQQTQDGSAGQFAQQGRGQDNNRRQQANDFGNNWQKDDSIVGADAVGGVADTGRGGQVYL